LAEMTAQADIVEVPEVKDERDGLRTAVREYVRARHLVPPLSMEELEDVAAAIVDASNIDERYVGFITVLVGNEVWLETLATVPYERRLLLLPQCLRARNTCSAEIDKFGLLCEECGNCLIGRIQVEAEELGYVVLIAEGTTVVTQLLARGKVDAVIGVSCLPALKRSFPHMASHAIPGIAIPLFRDGCVDTAADIDWITEAIHHHSRGRWSGRQDMDDLRVEVESWFEPRRLRSIAGTDGSITESVGMSWVAKAGKRWRPFLTASVFKAIKGTDAAIPDSISKIAVAVECFHKASLIHDDIEDDDSLRYGEKTLHREYGMPVALNVGDLLIGEGYRLITKAGARPEQTVRMLGVAAEGHRNLCIGQGEELLWTKEPCPISSKAVLDIFRRKTAPAFEVALQIGAICADADESVYGVLVRMSESLGISYQIRDDLDDLRSDHGGENGKRLGPSLLLALAYEHADTSAKQQIEAAWRDGAVRTGRMGAFREIVEAAHVEDKARQLLEHYKNDTIRCLSPLQNAHLKGLLRRIVTRILDGE